MPLFSDWSMSSSGASAAWSPMMLRAFVGSLLTSWLLVLTQRWHGVLSQDGLTGVQKVHSQPTPRVGGLGVLLGLALGHALAPPGVQALSGPLLWACLPAFLFGLLEDVTKRVGVAPRLLATMASGLLGWWLSGAALHRVDLPGVDLLLQWTLPAVLLTCVAVAGVANSTNIIDGCNGQASLAVVLGLLGYAGLALQMGDADLAGLALLLAATAAGFFWINWPFGKIFLGDGGAYLLGFGLGWVAVLLVDRHPEVSAFAVLMVFLHPVTEVLFSMWRRRIKRTPSGQPDRLHFHSLLMRRVVRRWLPGRPALWHNSVTGLVVGSATSIGAVLANLSHGSVLWSALLVLALMLAYVAMYARMVRFRWCSPIAFLLLSSSTKPTLAPSRIR